MRGSKLFAVLLTAAALFSSFAAVGYVEPSGAPGLAASTVTGWSNATTPGGPPPIAGAMMAYSSVAQRFILFGGWNGTTGINQTWSFDPGNKTWTELRTPTTPMGRGDAMLVYDSRVDTLILFGGWHELPNDTYTRLSDTWSMSLANHTWQQEHPADSPSARSDAMVAYDPASDSVLLFGGFDGAHYLGDVWSYSLTNDTWTPRPSSTQPPARADGRIVYVAGQDRFIMFGGNDYNGPGFTFHHLADTWSYQWDSNVWSQIPVQSVPEARDYPVFAEDVRDGMLLLTAGYGDRVILNDLWAFNLTSDNWVQLSSPTSPPARYAAVGGFDPIDSVFILFSGAGTGGLLNDVWTYTYSPPAPSAPSGIPAYVWVSVVVFAAGLGVALVGDALRTRRKRARMAPPDAQRRNQ